MIITPYRNNIFGGRGESAFTIAKSFYLDGVDEYFQLSNTNLDSVMVGSNLQFTILTSIKRTELSILNSLFAKDDVGANRSFWFRFQNTNQCEFILNDGISLKTDKWNFSTDLTEWYHLALVFDYTDSGNFATLYSNGSLIAKTTQATISGNIATGSANYNIGSSSAPSFYGHLYQNQLAVLDTPLSLAQYQNWYNNGNPKDPQQLFGSNCKFFFNPDNRTGDTAQFSVVDSVNSITATSVNLEDEDLSPLTPYSDAIQTIIDKYATLNAWSFANIRISGTTTTAYDYKGTHDLSNPVIANQPTFYGGDGNILNRPSAYFVTDDYLYKATADYLIGQSTGAIHAVFTTNADVSSQWAFFSSCDEASTNYFFNFVVYLGKIYFTIRNTTATGQRYEGYCNTTTILANTSYVVSIYQNGTTLQVLINGVAQSLVINNGTAGTYWFSDITNRDNISIGALIYSSSVYSDLDIALVQITSDSADATVLANHNELKTLYGI